MARAMYSASTGLSPSLLSTSTVFVNENDRIPTAKSVLPSISNDNDPRMIMRRIEANRVGFVWLILETAGLKREL